MEVSDLRIDEHILEKALRKQVSDETAKILRVTNYSLTNKGLNFLSDLHKVYLEYTVPSKNRKTKVEQLSQMIIKIEPRDKVSKKLVNQQDLFRTELKVLRDILPRITELVDCQIGPRLFYGCENLKFLAMENLMQRKFAMKDRQKGLSFEHCCLAMKQIAKFHAGSVAIHEKDPGLIESFEHGGILSAKCPSSFLRMVGVSLIRVGKEIQTWTDEKCANAGEKLIKLAETIGARCSDTYKYDVDEFCVLNHGDCWINNIMYKENEKGEPVDMLLVDYQMAVYTSPAIDLLYFLNICPEFNVKFDRDDYFLELYLNTLKETMKTIGCKKMPPTMQQLKDSLHKRRAYAVFAGVVLYLRMMANAEDTESFSEVLETLSGETKMDVFKNPDAEKLARKMIPVMNERGYFD